MIDLAVGITLQVAKGHKNKLTMLSSAWALEPDRG